MSERKDILGRPMDANETEIIELYERLKVLSAREDLAPCALMNVREAAATLWQAVTDLNLDYEHPYDVGV